MGIRREGGHEVVCTSKGKVYPVFVYVFGSRQPPAACVVLSYKAGGPSLVELLGDLLQLRPQLLSKVVGDVVRPNRLPTARRPRGSPLLRSTLWSRTPRSRRPPRGQPASPRPRTRPSSPTP